MDKFKTLSNKNIRGYNPHELCAYSHFACNSHWAKFGNCRFFSVTYYKYMDEDTSGSDSDDCKSNHSMYSQTRKDNYHGVYQDNKTPNEMCRYHIDSALAAKREMLEEVEKGTYKPETYYNENEDGPYPTPEHVESQKRQLESLEQQLEERDQNHNRGINKSQYDEARKLCNKNPHTHNYMPNFPAWKGSEEPFEYSNNPQPPSENTQSPSENTQSPSSNRGSLLDEFASLDTEMPDYTGED